MDWEEKGRECGKSSEAQALQNLGQGPLCCLCKYAPKDLAAQTKLAELQTFLGRYQDYPKYVRNNIMEYVNSPTGSDSWQDEAAGV
ncbi:hypothetical protein ACLKA7_011587 [Drosophila subpalustris]